MRQLIVHMMVSLDGFVAPPDDDESWMVAPDHERDVASLAVAEAAGVGLVGRGVLPEMTGYWPTAVGDTETQQRYVECVNAMEKLVVTHSDADFEWNARALVTTEDDFADRITALKEADGGPILAWGGARLVAQLAAHDLVDEYQLFVEPVVLGVGKPLFGDLDAWRRLRLVEATPYETGAILTRYVPDGVAA